MALRSPSKNNMSNIRSLFTSSEKIPPDLRHALALLKLADYSDLEERFLSLPAFLKSWSVFRDSLLLLAPESLSLPTIIKGAGADGISRIDLLWFYTQFDEGVLRYDSRADARSEDYTPDTSVHGMIDRSSWRVNDYEKHLYAWLLQEFKVGKAYNPYRFECFELKNICTVWEDVMVPIVNAVRASYNHRGRRHYGRLALFVEERCPSRLAFPEGNIVVGIPEGGILSPTPYRIMSAPKKTVEHGAKMSMGSYTYRDSMMGALTKRHYDDTEKELRMVYPQYGGLVERPKFKHKMEEWLAEQRARAERRKEQQRRDGDVLSSKPQIVLRNRSLSPSKQLFEGHDGSFRKQYRSVSDMEGAGSPIKQFADSIVQTFSRKEDRKSSLDGVTSQLEVPEREREVSEIEREVFEIDESSRSSMVISPLPRPELQIWPSEQQVYTSIRNSNPFNENIQTQKKAQARADTTGSVHTPKSQRARTNSADSVSVYSSQRQRILPVTDGNVFSPMGQLSAIPQPLWPKSEPRRCPVKPEPESVSDVDRPLEHPAVAHKKSYHDVRVPSYEGTAYQVEISLTDLHKQRLASARSPESDRLGKLATRLPAPITPIPYAGSRLALADKDRKAEKLTKALAPIARPSVSPSKPIMASLTATLKPVVLEKTEQGMWPGYKPPKQSLWPGFDSDDDSPPIPSKSPDRILTSHNPGQLRNPRSRQLVNDDRREHEMTRIISKENIRATLGDPSFRSSSESLAPPKPAAEPVRTISPSSKLQPYNRNMFPRKDPRKEEHKGTPVEAWFKQKAEEGQYAKDMASELEVLRTYKKGDQAWNG